MTYQALVMDINKAINRMAEVVEMADTKNLEKLLLGYEDALEIVARTEGTLDALKTFYYGVDGFDDYTWAFSTARREYDSAILDARYRIREALQ